MECDFGFICDYGDRDTKLHAVGIGWDIIFAPTVPVMHPHISFIAKLTGSSVEAGTKQVTVRFLDEDGENVVEPIEGPMPFEVKPGQLSATAQVILQFVNTTFTKYGEYAIHLLIGGETKKVVRFRVAPPPTTV